MWVTDPAVDSAMIRAFVEQRVRAPIGEEHDDIARCPSQRHRSRPRLQSRDEILDRSSNTTESSVSAACDLWDVFY